MSSAKGKSHKLASVTMKTYRRIRGPRVTANKVPDKGQPCLIPEAMCNSATRSLAKKISVANSWYKAAMNKRSGFGTPHPLKKGQHKTPLQTRARRQKTKE